jgi:alkylhydroperoxidase/carboxymuconolactone decarboxylase family protein YurZ
MTPVERLAQADAATAAAFQALRKAVMASGPLDERTVELIVTACFATVGQQASFIVHAKRLIALGVPLAEIRQAVLVTLAATTTFSDVTQALGWLDALDPAKGAA